RHYEARDQEGEAQKAIEGYEKILQENPNEYQVLWRLSKAYWYVGNHSAPGEKAPFFEKGMDAAKKAITVNPNDCEGHFWLGVNTALYAENSGMFKALGLIDDVKREMKRTMEIKEDCDCGGPQRVLGKLYARAPFFKGGSKSKSITYLQKSLEICPNDTQSRI